MLVRDKTSNALVQHDEAALNKYRVEKKRVKDFESLRREVSLLRTQVNKLTSIVEKGQYSDG